MKPSELVILVRVKFVGPLVGLSRIGSPGGGLLEGSHGRDPWSGSPGGFSLQDFHCMCITGDGSLGGGPSEVVP